MRLDKYLKVSRIVKRRTIANSLCDAGKVQVNSKPARASYDVKIEDIIELQIGNKKLKVKVNNINEYVKKEEAVDMYSVIGEEIKKDEI